MKKLISIIFLCVIISGAFIWWMQSTKKAQQTPAKVTPVSFVLDWTPNTDHTGLYVALAKGWYKQQGIDLKILPYSSAVSPSVAILSNKADIGIGSINDIVGNAAKGNHVVAIGEVLAHNTSGFIVLADSGIHSPKDLDGKTYGGYGSPFEDAVVSEVIKKDGGNGTFKDVTLSVDAMQALESKRIDFVWGLDGWEVVQAKHAGYNVKFFPITKYGIPDSPNLYFITTPEKIRKNPGLLKRFMTATGKGYTYASQHPKESAQIMIKTAPKGMFPDANLLFASQAVVSKEYMDSQHRWAIQDKQRWHAYPQFMLDSGGILDAAGKPVRSLDFDKLYTNEFLQ